MLHCVLSKVIWEQSSLGYKGNKYAERSHLSDWSLNGNSRECAGHFGGFCQQTPLPWGKWGFSGSGVIIICQLCLLQNHCQNNPTTFHSTTVDRMAKDFNISFYSPKRSSLPWGLYQYLPSWGEKEWVLGSGKRGRELLMEVNKDKDKIKWGLFKVWILNASIKLMFVKYQRKSLKSRKWAFWRKDFRLHTSTPFPLPTPQKTAGIFNLNTSQGVSTLVLWTGKELIIIMFTVLNIKSFFSK